MREKSTKFYVGAGVLLALGAVFYIWYCQYTMTELPHLTWFDQFPIVKDYFSDNLSWSTFCNRYGEHGMLGYNFLFLFNVAFLHMTTSFDVILNDINVIICGVLLLYAFFKTMQKRQHSLIVSLCGAGSIVLFNFGCMQGSSGAMETQVRLGILFFIIAAILIDYLLQSGTSSRIWLAVTIAVIFISLNLFGTLYSFAAAPLIFIVCFVLALRSKDQRIRVNAIGVNLAYVLGTVLYVFEYNLLASSSFQDLDNGGILSTVWTILTHPFETLLSVFSYAASSVLGYGSWTEHKISDSAYLAIGLMITLCALYAVWRFFQAKLYKYTWMPLFLMGYAIMVFVLTLIGRYNSWQWFINEWYQVHAKLLPISIVWILCLDVVKGKYFLRGVQVIACSALVVFTIFGNAAQLERAPWIKLYYEEKQPYLFVEDAKDMPVDENGLTPLIMPLDITMDCINTMREYKLSVYWYGVK